MTRQCLIDATYLRLERQGGIREDDIVTVIPEMKISAEDTCLLLLKGDGFDLLYRLITEAL